MEENYYMKRLGFEPDGRPIGWFSEIDGRFYLNAVRRHAGGTVVELGTWQGRSLSWILDYCKDTKTTIYTIDNWAGKNEKELEEIYEPAFKSYISNLKKLGGFGYVKIIRSDSIEAAKKFKDESVDIVLIDTSHEYEQTKNEINIWWPKIRHGGEMMGHDYIDAWPEVVKAVDEAFGKPDETATSTWRVKKIEGRKSN